MMTSRGNIRFSKASFLKNPTMKSLLTCISSLLPLFPFLFGQVTIKNTWGIWYVELTYIFNLWRECCIIDFCLLPVQRTFSFMYSLDTE
jgi:hypothetical protein